MLGRKQKSRAICLLIPLLPRQGRVLSFYSQFYFPLNQGCLEARAADRPLELFDWNSEEDMTCKIQRRAQLLLLQAQALVTEHSLLQWAGQRRRNLPLQPYANTTRGIASQQDPSLTLYKITSQKVKACLFWQSSQDTAASDKILLFHQKSLSFSNSLQESHSIHRHKKVWDKKYRNVPNHRFQDF